jgi:hypothetical protein
MASSGSSYLVILDVINQHFSFDRPILIRNLIFHFPSLGSLCFGVRAHLKVLKNS